MGVLHINKDNFKDEVLNSQGVVLVDFYADWCGPCRMMSPIIEELAKELKEIKFVKVNVDENPDLASEYQIFSIPTILIFKNGNVIHQFVGVIGKDAVIQKLKES